MEMLISKLQPSLPVALPIIRRPLAIRGLGVDISPSPSAWAFVGPRPLPPLMRSAPTKRTNHTRIPMVTQLIRLLVQPTGTTPPDHERGPLGQWSPDSFERSYRWKFERCWSFKRLRRPRRIRVRTYPLLDAHVLMVL